MTITLDDVITIKIKSKMRKRAEILAEKKLGYKYVDGELVKTGKDNIYNRYNYPREARWKKIYLGELAEEAVKEYMDTLNLKYICYNDCREDDFRDEDPFDFRIGSICIDLKSSKDNREHGLADILKEQHLITPVDQTVKPIIIQAFTNKDETEVWVVGWATEEELKREENLGYLHWQPGKYYKLKVKECHPMSEFKPAVEQMLRRV